MEEITARDEFMNEESSEEEVKTIQPRDRNFDDYSSEELRQLALNVLGDDFPEDIADTEIINALEQHYEAIDNPVIVRDSEDDAFAPDSRYVPKTGDMDNIVLVPPFGRRVEALEYVDPMTPGDFKLAKDGKLYKTVFEYQGRVGSLIETFDNWVVNVLEKQISSRKLTTGAGEITFEKKYFLPPRYATDKENKLLYPINATVGGTSYSAELYVDMILNKGKANEQRLDNKIFIGRIPVMIGSVLDNLRTKSAQEKQELGMCSSDEGGYFIINGNEKVVLIQENLRVGRMFTFASSNKGEPICRMTVNTPVGSSIITLGYKPKDQSIVISLPFMGRQTVKSKKIGNNVSIFQIYRMMGLADVSAMTGMILKYVRAEWKNRVMNKLLGSLLVFNNVGDDVRIIKDMMENKDKKEEKPEKPKRGKKAEKKKKKKTDEEWKEEIESSLNRELFPQIEIGEPDSAIKKLEMLSIMVARYTEYLSGYRQLEDRDHWGNKRLESAGRSMEKLFNGLWRNLISMVQTKIDENSLKTLDEVRREISASYIENAMFDSMNIADNWGVPGQMAKENIVETLKRDNPLAQIVHTTKISVPTNRLAKQPKLRMVHESQLGYICPAHTPEGEQCLTLDSLILLDNGNQISLQQFFDTPNLLITTVQASTLKQEPSNIINPFSFFSSDKGKILYQLTTINGRTIKATNDHPFLVDKPFGNDWINAENLEIGDRLWIAPSPKSMSEKVDEYNVLSILNVNIKTSLLETHEKVLREIKLLPLMSTDVRLPILARMFGYIQADGSVGIYEEVPFLKVSFDGEEDKKEFDRDYEKIGIADRLCFATLMLALGGSESWVKNGSDLVKREYVAGFFSRTEKAVTDELAALFQDLGVYSDNNSFLVPYMEIVGYRYSSAKKNIAIGLSEYEKCKDTMTIKEFLEENPVREGKIAIKLAKKEEIPAEMVADFTTVSKNHSFIANGFVTHNCGLIKNSAVTLWITLENDGAVILDMVENFLKKEPSLQYSTVFWLNNRPQGWCDGKVLKKLLIDARRENLLPKGTAIVLDKDNVLNVFCDGGRPTRPLLVIDEDGQLRINKLKAWGDGIEELMRKGCVEYIDAYEQDYIRLAVNVADAEEKYVLRQTLVKKKMELLEQIKMRESIESMEEEEEVEKLRSELHDLDASISKEFLEQPYTHCEIHPSAYMGIAYSLVPLANFDQGPRGVYACAHQSQALGSYHSNHRSRYDTTFKTISHPSPALVQTELYDIFGMREHPTGENIRIAFMIYTGLNQEDSLIFNQAAIDRGLFRMVVYKSFKLKIEGDKNVSSRERFARPEPGPHEDASRYAAMDENGYPIVGAKVKEGDYIIGKIRETPSGVQNASMKVGIGMNGIISDVIKTNNMIRVKIREERIPEVGDKFASRHAQKATAGCIMPVEDMPFDTRGLVPDVIVNPHCIPSRMTMGMLFEMVMGKTATLTGEFQNATSHRAFNIDIFKKKLIEYGYTDDGNETFINGKTGKMMKCRVFTGPCYYMALRHHVKDKIQVRARGAVDSATKQPNSGRSRNGGLRLGEMERDSIISHGGSETLRERLCLVSDAHNVPHCLACGNIAVPNIKEETFTCSYCDSSTDFGTCEYPFVVSLMFNYLAASGIKVDFKFKKPV